MHTELKEIDAASCFDTEKLANICAYKNAKYFSWIPASIIGLAITLVLVCTGFYPWLFNVVCRVTGTPNGFASTVAGCLCRGKSLQEAAAIAADYVVESIKNTIDDKDHWYSVKFEKAIPYLIKKIY